MNRTTVWRRWGGILLSLALLTAICPFGALTVGAEILAGDEDYRLETSYYDEEEVYATINNFAGLKKALASEYADEIDEWHYENDEEPFVFEEDFVLDFGFYATALVIPEGVTLTVNCLFNTMDLTVNGRMILGEGRTSIDGRDWDQILELHNNGAIEGAGDLTLQYMSGGGEYNGNGTVADTVTLRIYSMVESDEDMEALRETARRAPANFRYVAMMFDEEHFGDAVDVDVARYGDPDGDGKITSTDARLALQMSVQKIKEEDIPCPEVLDVDGDKSVTSTDARLILQYSVGKISEWP